MSGNRTKPARAATRPTPWLALAAATPLALAACQVPDTSGADATWSPKGMNAANLAAMVADPADLVRGRDDPGPDHKLAARAVLDLWTNPTGAGASAGGGSAGGAAAGGAAAGGGASGGGASGGSGGGTASGTGAGN
jgi:uncharacterized membrane protein YgcG